MTHSPQFLIVEKFPDYRVGDDGSVWSKKTGEWVQLKQSADSDGYLMVVLREGGCKRSVRVHRLVLEEFRGPCPENCEGAHDNGNHTDNRLSNLFWKTHESNIDDCGRHGTRRNGSSGKLRAAVPRRPVAKLTAEKAVEIRERASRGESLASIARAYGVNEDTIGHVVHRRTWKQVGLTGLAQPA